MDTTLIIMAAGIGSRYGAGIKQLAKMGPNGEIIMDYSIRDAKEAGFNKVVFIIRKDIFEEFEEIIGSRIKDQIDVEYVFQELDDLPEGFEVPEGRTKPWGTGQAVLCCKDIVKEPFVIINADDYYGKEAFVKLHDFLVSGEDLGREFTMGMAGFILKNTLSDNGTVTRGVSVVDENGLLSQVHETTGIMMGEDGKIKCEEKHIIYLHFTMDDNLSLSEKIKERYRSMYVGVFFKRYILGLWCVAEGLVYSMFDEEKHVTDEHMSGALEYIVSIDYGTVNPFSAGLWAFDGKYSQREAELYYNSREAGKRVDDEAYYKMLKELIGDRKVSCIIIDPSAASFIEVIKKYGEYTVKKADNDVLDGIRVVTTMLNKGLLKIYKDCTSCINEFGLYCWDEEKNNDTVIKENDHAMDDTRYYVYTFLRRRLRWKY